MKITVTRPIGVFLILLCMGVGLARAQEINADIYGSWRISGDLTPEGAITAKTTQQVRATMGKIALIGPNSFAFNGNKCSDPDYTRSTDDTMEYFYREWRIDAATLPLGPRVTIVDVGCAFYVIYPIDRHRLLIADDGIFFEAVRLGGPAPWVH